MDEVGSLYWIVYQRRQENLFFFVTQLSSVAQESCKLHVWSLKSKPGTLCHHLIKVKVL